MHFHKYPHPANFEFPGGIVPNRKFRTRKGAYLLSVQASADDVYHLRVTGQGWEKSESQAGLKFRGKSHVLSGEQTSLHFNDAGDLQLKSKTGEVLLASLPRRFFGQQGQGSIFEFVREAGHQFYGFGEKRGSFEHSGKTVKFWNTDVWGDFHPESFINLKPAPDPIYVSIPYLIIKHGNTYTGLLLDNPFATYVSTQFSTGLMAQKETGSKRGAIYLCAEKGEPNLYILHGPSLPELTRKLQRLVGTTPRPPAWALGYHQCRWGYESEADLLELDRQFRKHKIPVDGLWLDIDYMDGYRVFTFAKKHFSHPSKAAAKLAKSGRKIIPIIDPGVKFEKGYPVYESGHRAKVFCENQQGNEYIGLVWPGETAFPDFSLKHARDWWAGQVKKFAEIGLNGAWLDMNDPSTGPSDNVDMLFDHGRKSHDSYHNQYALGMAMASRQGFLEAHPNERPFLLCRSGFIGTGRYTAIWTGDNFSNYAHLRGSIATTLNLALSGIPFNGPDAGGFAGDITPELIRDWYKAGFLFPVFRNHSMVNTRKQEPWAFDAPTLKVLRHYIQLRYRLRPYLYQLFIRQEQSGQAILRPLFYDFADDAKLPLGLVDDQFLVGPQIMQAPFVQPKQKSRDVVLPGKAPWFDATAGQWIRGHRKLTVTARPLETPLYIRDGSILPLARINGGEHAFDSAKVDFHIYISDNATATTRYYFDDGHSFAYQSGEFSEVEITAVRKGYRMEIDVRRLEEGHGPGKFTFTTESGIRNVTVNGVAAKISAAQGLALGRGKSRTWRI